MSGQTYFNANYKGTAIHLGGQPLPVNYGVITLTDEDNDKWGSQMSSLGFSIVEVNQSETVEAEKPKIENQISEIEIHDADQDTIKEDNYA